MTCKVISTIDRQIGGCRKSCQWKNTMKAAADLNDAPVVLHLTAKPQNDESLQVN